jgi:hypothetical protein
VNVLSGVVGMVAVMLAAGGVSKALAPDPTVASFRAVGLPGRRGLVRTLAVIEVALGLGLIVVGTPWLAVLGAAVFMVFTGISARLLALGDQAASCGCFGAQSSRPSVLHVVIDALAAAVLAAAAVVGLPGLASDAGSALDTVVYLGLVLIGGYLLTALLTVLPDALDAAAGRDANLAAATEFKLSR